MQFSPNDLKEKLLKTLDKDNNVVDMSGLLEVISVLEKYPITKESLEQTRIGRIVNELRKRTECRELARRARSLVRTWQHLLLPSSGSRAAINGDGVTALPSRLLDSRPSSPSSRPGTPASVKSCVSPALPTGRTGQSTRYSPVASPVCGVAAGRTSSPAYTPRCSTPLAGGKHASPASTPLTTGRRSSPAYTPRSAMLSSSKSSSPVVNTPRAGGRHCSPLVNSSLLSGKHSSPACTPCTVVSPDVHLSGSDSRDTSPTLPTSGTPLGTSASSVKPGNKKRRLEIDTQLSSSSSKRLDNANHKVNGLVGDVASAKLTSNGAFMRDGTAAKLERNNSGASLVGSKVKTTAQLIQGMHASGDLRLTRSETVTKIALNQIEKEAEEDQSVVPAEAKPRARRKVASMLPAATTQSMSQTKNELVQKFLQTSCPPVQFDLMALPPPADEPHSAPGGAPWTRDNDTTQVAESTYPQLPPLNLDDIRWSDSEDEDAVKTRAAVCEADVDRLHNEHWSGVNGQFDAHGEWTDWTQCLSQYSYDGQLLHVLPYVDIDVADYKLSDT